jgi:DNA (cytosine-5)-methyltransferase 1
MSSLIYGSVCSGIEAASVAWHQLGWRPAFFSEIEPFPCAVLAHHYPDVPNHGDMTRYKEWPDANIDVLVGGTPCQSFSVAGLRKGLTDPRGNLTLTYLAIAERYRPKWVVWENVPGVLSDKSGAFGAFLGGLAELGYGWAYRILDAQYFGLAQRRKRVFVVGSARGWTAAAAVLFERASLQGNPAPSRKAEKNTSHELSPSIGASGRGFSRAGETRGQDPVIAMQGGVSRCLTVGGRFDYDTETFVTHSLRADGFDASEDGTGRGTPLTLAMEWSDDGVANAILTPNGGRGGIGVGAVAFNARQDPDAWAERTGPIDTNGMTQAVAFSCKDHGADAGEVAPTLRAMGHTGSHANGGGQIALAISTAHTSANGHGISEDVAYTLDTAQGQAVAFQEIGDCLTSTYGTKWNGNAAATNGSLFAKQAMQVRRLTPRECERLQGFPDDYTQIPYRNKPASDGPRYKALGNSMAVPVMAWIGKRIAMVNDLEAQ